jgi:hypothetical protein
MDDQPSINVEHALQCVEQCGAALLRTSNGPSYSVQFVLSNNLPWWKPNDEYEFHLTAHGSGGNLTLKTYTLAQRDALAAQMRALAGEHGVTWELEPPSEPPR